MQRFKNYCYGFFFLMCCSVVVAKPITAEQIPPVLQTWEEWVLYDEPDYTCPFLYKAQESRYCAWPTQLSINVEQDKIYFNQIWRVFAPSIIALPGDTHLWPQQVQVNGEYYPLTERDAAPVMELSEGTYNIQGFLSYGDTLPEFIKIPDNTGLVQLVQDKKNIPHPRLDDSGHLWLHYADNQSMNAALQLRIFRKVTQAVPMEVLTLIELDVSGPAREVQLGPVLLPGSIAMRLDSSLPAQLDENGLLRVQLRPGKWQIEISERFPLQVDTLKRAEVGPPWPAEEIWAFDLDPRLGGITISGVPSVDPTQTLMPDAWRNLPAYRVLVADSVLLSQAHASHVPENQLTLVRHMWLDFSGQLWTVEDTLQGQMLSGWRLSLKQPFVLGQFSLADKPQLISVSENAQGDQIPGVEVRQGQLNAQALSLIKNTWRMNVTGWEETFNHVSTTLSLPPGWQLLTALGVDELTGSVLSQWSLFDIFIVLLITLAIATVLDKKWGILAFFMLLLTYHQVGVPLLIWLNLVLALWAVQWFKSSRARKLLVVYRDLSFVVLAVMIIWLSSLSLINSLYPQITIKTPSVQEAHVLVDARPMTRKMEGAPLMVAPDPFAVPVDAKTQTGPARPAWEWTQVQMNWQSPVASDQNVYLLLMSPLILRVLTMLQIILSIAVGLRLWQMRTQNLQMNINISRKSILFFPLLAVLFLGTATTPGYAQDIPDAELLNTLKERLLAPQDCLPQCASIGAALVNVVHDEIYLSLQIDALAPVAVPIPGRFAYWQADQVFVNQLPAQGLSWRDDTLMVQLDKGHHTVMVYGRAHDMDKVSLEFPLNPYWLEVTAPDWFVEGLDNKRLSGNTLHLLRRDKGSQNEMVTAIQPFVRVIRSLSLGLTGEVTTTVERISPVAGAIQLNIPLLAHESIITQGILVQNNQAQISFAPHQKEVTWQSTLANFNDLTLLAAETNSWVEQWRVKISPIWHPTITGIPALYESNVQQWQSQWQPWPSQSVHIQLNRLPAMPGPTLTIDQVNLVTRASARGSEVSMQALLRSTLGGQHTLILPKEAILQSVRVNGVEQVGQNNNEVVLSFGPGNNWIDLVWHTAQSVGLFTRTPLLDWGMPAYNINLGLDLPSDRFVLALGGAGYGPALLYWIWAMGAIVLALVLGKMKNTPLRVYQWLILLLGLSLLTPFLGLWVVVALVLLSLYDKFIAFVSVRLRFVTQFFLGVLLLVALAILIYAMIQGLRDMPNMHLLPSALGSTLNADYVWLQDFGMKTWPRAWIISLPVWMYRGLMLLWSLWVVITLLRLVVKANFLNRKPGV